jgi:hypothetical protein
LPSYSNYTWKSDVCADEKKDKKKKRKVISLLEKVEVLDKLDKGMNTAAVRYQCGVNEHCRSQIPMWCQ